MYHEEKVIDGVLHWRGTPKGAFTPYTIEQLTQKFVDMEKERNHLKHLNAQAEEIMDRMEAGESFL